jgi:hypothetical protein
MAVPLLARPENAMPLSAADFSSGSLLRAAELATSSQAEHWASACGWVPGTGHCQNRDCSAQCLFHLQWEAEAGQIKRRRRRRRPAQQPFAERGGGR